MGRLGGVLENVWHWPEDEDTHEEWAIPWRQSLQRPHFEFGRLQYPGLSRELLFPGLERVGSLHEDLHRRGQLRLQDTYPW